MSIFEDTDAINAFLAQLAEQDIVEPVAEPCDCADAHPLDWAEVVGISDDIFDEMYPHAELMVDNEGNSWYVS